MNKDHDYNGVVANQLQTLEHLGIFTESLPAPPEQQDRLVDYRDPQEDLNLRARSYLHANCAHCHVKWGGGNAEFQLVGTMTLEETGSSCPLEGLGARRWIAPLTKSTRKSSPLGSSPKATIRS